MKILSMDTSGDSASVALAYDERTAAEKVLEQRRRQSAYLMPEIDSLLSENGINIKDIDVFAVAEGPGSFTGLRIGMCTMKALAYAVNGRLVTVPSLEAAAHNAQAYAEEFTTVCVLTDARNRQVYAAAYDLDGFRQFMLPCAGDIDSIMEALHSGNGAHERRILFIGSGAAAYGDAVKAAFGEDACIRGECGVYPGAAAVAKVAYHKAATGEFADTASAAPEYLRKSQAERMREERTNE